MPYISPDQLARAREMDLLTYLQHFEPEELVPFSGSTYTTRSHDSLKISNGKWFWWSRGIGGYSALDYLVRVRECTLPEAVERITGAGTIPPHRPPPAQKTQQRAAFALPPRHTDHRRVFSYLRSRGIDAEILRACLQSGRLYEDAIHHNCVFVGFDGDTPRYAALRGTLSSSTFVGEVTGSDKRFSFSVVGSAGGAVCLFESAIDALSYLTLLKDHGRPWQRANCLSLGGIKSGIRALPPTLAQYLKQYPATQRIILCLDRDEVGRAASESLVSLLQGYEVVDLPPKCGKDYNDQLRQERGLRTNVKTRGEAVTLLFRQV